LLSRSKGVDHLPLFTFAVEAGIAVALFYLSVIFIVVINAY